MTQTEKEIGSVVVAILKDKCARQGIELRPQDASRELDNAVNNLGCTQAEYLSIMKKLIIPAVLHGCKLGEAVPPIELEYEEIRLVCRILKWQFFYDLRSVGNEVKRISASIGESQAKVAMVIRYIATAHLEKELVWEPASSWSVMDLESLFLRPKEEARK